MKKIILFLVVITLIIMISFLLSKKTEVRSKDELRSSHNIKARADNKSKERASMTVEMEKSTSSSQAPYFLHNGQLLLELDFHDPTLTDKEKLRISKDLNEIYSHLTIKIDEIEEQKYLVFEGEGRVWPDVLDEFLKVHKVDEQLLLDIPMSLCEAYKDAFKFIEENQVSEKEVEELLVNAESGNLTTDLLSVPRVPEITLEKKEQAIHYMSLGLFKQPSVLSYQFVSKNGNQELIGKTLFLEYDQKIISSSREIWVIREESQWKILPLF